MIVAGFGFRAAATRASLEDAYARTQQRADAFATAHDKIGPALHDLAAHFNVPVIGVEAANLVAQTTQTQSQASASARGIGSVAEAAALAAAGPGARLLAPRVTSADRMATCALAQGDPP